MSKIEELIRQYCLKGVEFKELQEVFVIKNGYKPSKAKAEYWTDGTIPWFRMEDILTNGRVLSDSIQHITPEAVKGNSLFPTNSIIVATIATIGKHVLIIIDGWCKNNINAGGFASVDMGKFKKYCFPTPTLPIQQEIVNILHKFTQLERSWRHAASNMNITEENY